MYSGITSTTSLKKNDRIDYKTYDAKNEELLKGVLKPKSFFQKTQQLEVYLGPDVNLFPEAQIENCLTKKIKIGPGINRMGYRLSPKILPHSKSIITSPVIPGTVQLTPEGQLIVLMKDAQTTGGYPRIFQLTETAIAILAQKWEGDIVRLIKRC